MLAYDASPNSPCGCEVKGRLDDAARWQARSMIARQDVAPKIQKKLIALTLNLLLGVPGVARADLTFNFTPIDVPNSAETEANANSPNAIAGDYVDIGGITHGFVLRGSVYTTIDKPGASLTTVNGISAPGQLAGMYQDATRLHAYFWNNGTFTTLDPPGSTRSQGFFLNAQGQVVGVYRDSTLNINKRHGFLWSRGTFINTMINVPGDHPVLGTSAIGINDRGLCTSVRYA
jgi:hypothetical protein